MHGLELEKLHSATQEESPARCSTVATVMLAKMVVAPLLHGAALRPVGLHVFNQELGHSTKSWAFEGRVLALSVRVSNASVHHTDTGSWQNYTSLQNSGFFGLVIDVAGHDFTYCWAPELQ